MPGHRSLTRPEFLPYAFGEAQPEEIRRARRKASTLALAMLDIGPLKLYNDTYGRAAGDKCLAQVTATIRVARCAPLTWRCAMEVKRSRYRCQTPTCSAPVSLPMGLCRLLVICAFLRLAIPWA
jgi:Diguanylate cyclase, GGDEF domain